MISCEVCLNVVNYLEFPKTLCDTETELEKGNLFKTDKIKFKFVFELFSEVRFLYKIVHSKNIFPPVYPISWGICKIDDLKGLLCQQISCKFRPTPTEI